MRTLRRDTHGNPAIAILAVIVIAALALVFFAGAFVSPPPFARFDVRMSGDYSCGMGYSAVDCWASNESLNLDTAARTVIVKLDVIRGTSPAINPDDLALAFLVRNDAPPQFGAGGEIAQPVYLQVTRIDAIRSSQGAQVSIANRNNFDQLIVFVRNFAGTDSLIEQRQTFVGTLLSGGSATAKLSLQLSPGAFGSSYTALGAAYLVSGEIAGQTFTITVRVNSLAG